MLKYEITLEVENSNFDLGIAQQLHGYLYESLEGFIDHDCSQKQFTQYVRVVDKKQLVWIINVIDDKIINYFENLIKYIVSDGVCLRNIHLTYVSFKRVETLQISSDYKVIFETPFLFKNKKTGKYTQRFCQHSLRKTLVNLNENLSLEDCVFSVTDMNLQVSNTRIGKTTLQGIKGFIDIKYEGDDIENFQKSLWILSITGYGIKTKLGMGGVYIDKV